MINHLSNETSPYLLQHSENPVDWYPWCADAFEKAKIENKPVFVSIGYSTCHWCHVMAHESFEDEYVADILNKYFISIKVDKEERPDLDSVYMNVCQAMTGSGGWPMSVFMTPEQKPFFAGSYFPKESQFGMIGFTDLLLTINEKWTNDKDSIINSAENVIEKLTPKSTTLGEIDSSQIETSIKIFKSTFDEKNGGFGTAPKFPSPHNLMFLMRYYEVYKDEEVLNMVEKTLTQMYKGGMFDHIGYGFSRYSTDKYYLVPHFEKMLYDNALLIMSYCECYMITKNELYKEIAVKTATYIQREMTSKLGGFYSAQDADSDGVEGKYYVFEFNEILNVLGEETGKKFNDYYNITRHGNFEGKNIPNLLISKDINKMFDKYLEKIYKYRKDRTNLHLDDKILTSWNSLMISAFTMLYRVTSDKNYLDVALKANDFISKFLCKDDVVFVSSRDNKISQTGFLDDYAFYIKSLLDLYDVTFDRSYLKNAEVFCSRVVDDFYDDVNGGFYLSGKQNEQLIMNNKETFDGAIPSGNSVMAYNLLKLYNLTDKQNYNTLLKNQLKFLSNSAKDYSYGVSFYLLTLLLYIKPTERIVVVLKDKSELNEILKQLDLYSNVSVLYDETEEYKLQNNKTTFYICKENTCLPATNDLKL